MGSANIRQLTIRTITTAKHQLNRVNFKQTTLKELFGEKAGSPVTEVGAIEDVAPMRSRQAQLYWLLGDEESSAAAMAEAQRAAERVTWPNALAELALSKAELARWSGDAEQAHRQLDVATALLGDDAERAIIRAVIQDLLGYLAELGEYERSGHEDVGRLAAELGVGLLVVVGEQAAPIGAGAAEVANWGGKSVLVSDQAAAIAVLRDELRDGDVPAAGQCPDRGAREVVRGPCHMLVCAPPQ